MATMTKEEVEQLLAERDAKNDLKIQMMMAASTANIKMTQKRLLVIISRQYFSGKW